MSTSDPILPTPERYAEFVQLLTRNHAAVLGYIFSLVPNWSDAEDVLQQTSLLLWEKFDEFEPGSSFARWACTVARFKVMTFLRSRRRDLHVFSDTLHETLAIEGEEELERLEAERRALSECLGKLPARDRETLAAYYSRENSVRQLAEQRRLSPFAIYKAISRARDALLRCIEGRLAAEGWI